MKSIRVYSLLFIAVLHLNCTAADDFKVLKETTGPYKANCYLFYDVDSREAAIIDPGWQIDTLVAFIRNNDLHLKYIFITHGHTDHYYYVPQLKRLFPKAKWCLSREDFENIINCPDWPLKAYGKEWVEKTRMDRDARVYLDFDTKSVGIPDIFVEGNQVYKLGSVKIKTILTPGHTPGGICYYSGNILFTGDELFYRSVGNLDKQTSNKEKFIMSVRQLYRFFPDSTIVYPGHNQLTDIGSEKKENKRISLYDGEYDVR